jgi:hypothetical protein
LWNWLEQNKWNGIKYIKHMISVLAIIMSRPPLSIPHWSGSNVSTRTVRRDLHKMGFLVQAGAQKSKITMRNTKRWLEWCKTRRQWQIQV